MVSLLETLSLTLDPVPHSTCGKETVRYMKSANRLRETASNYRCFHKAAPLMRDTLLRIGRSPTRQAFFLTTHVANKRHARKDWRIDYAEH